MGILKKIFNPTSSKPFNLISAVEQHDTKNIIRHLESKSLPKNPAAIPYTAEAIMKDLDIIYEFQKIYNPTHDEFAAAIAIKMLHLTMKSTMDWLAKNSYDSPPLEHMIYIGTFLTTLQSIQEFKECNIKKFKVSSCKDERVCSICSEQDGKVHLVSDVCIGQNAPPFCKKCRCNIRPIFKGNQ